MTMTTHRSAALRCKDGSAVSTAEQIGARRLPNGEYGRRVEQQRNHSCHTDVLGSVKSVNKTLTDHDHYQCWQPRTVRM